MNYACQVQDLPSVRLELLTKKWGIALKITVHASCCRPVVEFRTRPRGLLPSFLPFPQQTLPPLLLITGDMALLSEPRLSTGGGRKRRKRKRR